METGILEKIYDQYKLKDVCLEQRMAQAQSTHAITLPEIMALFLILGVGLCAAALVFFTEVTLRRMASCARQASLGLARGLTDAFTGFKKALPGYW